MLLSSPHVIQGFPGGSVVKNLPANAGDTGSILGQENPMREEMATHSSILAWRISWTEEPSGLQSMGSQPLSALASSVSGSEGSAVTKGPTQPCSL